MRTDPIRTTGRPLTRSGRLAVAADRQSVTSGPPAQRNAACRAMLHVRQRCLTAGGMFRLASEA
ncbi:hypothetical protein BLA9940_06570 [Burkholderia aenigmatica]|nr:hypothetical protein BLA9940_06570 [Burkholderia aenigmatica]